jgi:hypothetical protein
MNHGDFKVASSVRINLPPHIFKGGPWTHLATITRSLSEYVVLLKSPSPEDPEPRIYLEQITATGRFVQIEDDSLWNDLVYFATSKGLTGEVAGKEIVIAR